MFEPREEININETLAEVIRSKDTRLCESFPVLLANASDSFEFDADKVSRALETDSERTLFRQLLLASIAIYKMHHLKFSWVTNFYKALPAKDQSVIKEWRNALAENKNLIISSLSTERMKKTFELYFEQNAERSRIEKNKAEEFSLSFALSQVFSAKQKELFMKKLKGHPMSKTEQEYYSRSVKRKVVALANTELHTLARKILEK